MAQPVASKLETSLRGLGLRPRRMGLPGEPPGTMRPPERVAPASLSVFDYNAESLQEASAVGVQTAMAKVRPGTVTWINVDGLNEPAVLARLSERFRLHPLLMEDVTNLDQRPKVEPYPDQLFLVARMARLTPEGPVLEQVSIVLGLDFVLTFQDTAGDVFDPIRDRLRQGKGRIRAQGPDYLAYRLLDAVVDGYYPVLDAIAGHLEALEDEAVEAPARETLLAVQEVRRALLGLRHAIWPLREAVADLLREEDNPLIRPDTRVFLRDVEDHIVQLVDLLETYHDLANTTLETYHSTVDHRANEVMKVLTVVATVFIPLTFVASIYGMNFDPDASAWSMPELRSPYGYVAVLGAMLLIASGMLYAIRRRGWLG